MGYAHHAGKEIAARQSLLEPSHAMRRGDMTESRHQHHYYVVEGEEGGLGSDVRTPGCSRLHLRGARNAATIVGYKGIRRALPMIQSRWHFAV